MQTYEVYKWREEMDYPQGRVDEMGIGLDGKSPLAYHGKHTPH